MTYPEKGTWDCQTAVWERRLVGKSSSGVVRRVRGVSEVFGIGDGGSQGQRESLDAGRWSQGWRTVQAQLNCNAGESDENRVDNVSGIEVCRMHGCWTAVGLRLDCGELCPSCCCRGLRWEWDMAVKVVELSLTQRATNGRQ